MNQSDSILFRFDAPGEPTSQVSYVLCDAGGQPTSAEQHGSLADVAAVAEGRALIGLLPASAVVETRVRLPRTSNAKMRLALPYALEDQIAGDAEAQHYALGEADANGEYPVAIVARELVADVVVRCRDAGLALAALHADAACIAPKPGDIQAWVDGDDLYLRHPDGRMQTLPSNDLPAMLRIAKVDAPDAPVLGLRLHGVRVDALATQALPEITGGVRAVALAEGVLPWLAAQRALAAPIDLLQGEFATPRGMAAVDLGPWRGAIVAAAALAVVTLIAGIDTWWRARAAESATDVALLEAGRGVLPQGTEARDAGSLLRTRVGPTPSPAALDRIPALPPIAAVIATMPQGTVRLRQLVLAEARVVLSLTVADRAALDATVAALVARGYAATPGAARQNGGGLEAEVTITTRTRVGT